MLLHPVHGQLYAALRRCCNHEHLKVLINKDYPYKEECLYDNHVFTKMFVIHGLLD